MERIRRTFFKLKKPIKVIDSSKKDDENIYLEPQNDETSNIALHIDIIAEELLTIAKKSVRKILILEFNYFYSSSLIQFV
jgi:hypothetical protein